MESEKKKVCTVGIAYPPFMGGLPDLYMNLSFLLGKKVS